MHTASVTGERLSHLYVTRVVAEGAWGVPSRRVAHLEENIASVAIDLSDEEFAALDREGKAQYVA